MKIAIPASASPGLHSVVHGHVATAPIFVIDDSDSDEIVEVSNPVFKEGSSELNVVGIVRSLKVDALICAGVGEWAVKLIEAAGTKVYLAHGGLVSNAIDDFNSGKLKRASEGKSGQS